MAIPERVPLAKLMDRLNQDVDIFICAASYEARCLSIPLRIQPNVVARALVCANHDHLERMESNFDRLKRHFGGKGREVLLRTDNPLISADRLKDALEAVDETKARRLLIDITTFTHEGLLILIRLLSIFLKATDQVWIVYAPASEYAVGLEQQQKWLSRGVREIRSVLGYPGLFVPSQKMHLIILVGFEAERAKHLIDACEPDAISLGKGRDATDDAQNHLPTNIRTLREISVHYPRYDEFDFSCIDPIATKQSLELQIAKYPGHNAIVAPMNTKLSTIGAALLGLESEKIQLCYAPAVTYNTSSYSAPGDSFLLFQLHLADVASRRKSQLLEQ